MIPRLLRRNLSQRTADVVRLARTFSRTRAHRALGAPTIAWMLSALENDKSLD
jgi:hypothetical protein